MESLGGFSFSDMNQTMRKKRSDRRPRNDVHPENGSGSLSSSPPSDNGSKGLSDSNVGRKILDLIQINSRASCTNPPDADFAPSFDSEFGIQESSDGKETGVDTSEVSASNNKDTKSNTPVSDGHNSGSLEVDSDANGVDHIVKKVKLKVGGVTRTIHAKPSSDPDQDYSGAQGKGSGLRGIPWKDFSKSGFFVGKAEESICTKKSEIHDSVQKSRCASKRHLLDDEEEEDDAELRYLAKMKLKSTKVDDEDEDGSKKQRKISSFVKMESRKKSKTGRESEDNDYRGEEQSSSGMIGEDSSREMTVITRRKALNSGRDMSADSTSSLVEFPHGLPPAPSRKQKEKLSEVEQQLKKAEAAQRRRVQAAKAARESEAEAIRKILGQESSRKKRENKMKQRQEELAQERTSNAAMLTSNTVRWVVRPTGTVVTFSDDIGLPNIFESGPCSYPPPREKCAGPSCSKPFKYRDSRSKLPLCSLQCYKAVQEKTKHGAVY